MAEVVVLALPMLLALYFAAAYTVAYAVFRSSAPQRMVSLAAPLYAIFLLGVWATLRLQAPLTHAWAIPEPPVTWLAAALALGPALFVFELWSSTLVNRRTRDADGSMVWKLIEGDTQQVAEAENPSLTFGIWSAVLVVLEEIVYRGLCITVLRSSLLPSTTLAVICSAGIFGLCHYWFGLRNVALKTIDGTVWGWLAVGSGSLFTPILSHLAFQAFVWRRLAAQHADGTFTSRARSLPAQTERVNDELMGHL
jgi:membrane protease YdiL (CAAX protease family)